MLEKYKDNYGEFYTIMNNAIKEDKISHAYMFELDEAIDMDTFIKDICKALMIRNKKENEYLNSLIDSGNYPNIKIIKADGLWIKKEQILEIQNDFRKESFDNNLKIYVIEDASKLNNSSAYTLLKFLEEPEDKIVAILLTKNKYSVIKTILSRCINISLKKKTYLDLDKEDISYKFVEIIEKYQKKSLPYLYQLVLDNDLERKDFFVVLEQVQRIYSDLLHNSNSFDSKYNYFRDGLLDFLDYEKNTDIIIKKIETINENSNYLNCNVNIKTVIDKIIADVYGGE